MHLHLQAEEERRSPLRFVVQLLMRGLVLEGGRGRGQQAAPSRWILPEQRQRTILILISCSVGLGRCPASLCLTKEAELDLIFR